jgi:hypothetical protein
MRRIQNDDSVAIFTAYEGHSHQFISEAERELLRAVLWLALNDLKANGMVKQKATDFFLSSEEDHLYSFQSICNYLNLDPEGVLRSAGLKIKDRNLSRKNSRYSRIEAA